VTERTHRGYLAGCQCEYCDAYRKRAREYARAHPDSSKPSRRPYKTAKQRLYDDAEREQVNARARERYALWREQNPKPARPPARPRRPNQNRHGGDAEWARMWGEQHGRCYLCLRPLPEDRKGIHVDHDHSCCDPGPKGRNTDSCQHCRRGLTHERCNQIWGLANEDAELLRIMACEGERVQNETRLRIATRAYEQGALI
jgi:hypothetical protein